MTRNSLNLGKKETVRYFETWIAIIAFALHETSQANNRNPAIKITFRFEIRLYSFPIEIHFHYQDKLQGSLRSAATHTCQHGQVVIVLRSGLLSTNETNFSLKTRQTYKTYRRLVLKNLNSYCKGCFNQSTRMNVVDVDVG